MAVSPKPPKKPIRPARRGLGTAKPRRGNTRRRPKGGGLLRSWRPLLLTALLLVSLGALTYLVFLHQPGVNHRAVAPGAATLYVGQQPQTAFQNRVRLIKLNHLHAPPTANQPPPAPPFFPFTFPAKPAIKLTT